MQEVTKDSTEKLLLRLPWQASARWWFYQCEVRIATPSTPLPDTWTAGEMEDVQWTLAAASKGATSITRTANAGADEPQNHRPYIIMRDASYAEVDPIVVEIAQTAGTSRTLREPLPRDVAAGSFLFGLTASVSLTAAQTSEAGHGLVLWRMTPYETIDGRNTHYFETGFRIVKRLTQAPYTLGASELTRMYPAIHRLKPTTDVGLDETIENAWTLYLRPSLEDRHIDVNLIKSWERLHPALAAASIYHLASQREDMDQDYVAAKWDAYERQRDSLLNSREFWYDVDDDRSLDPDADPEAGSRAGAARKVR